MHLKPFAELLIEVIQQLSTRIKPMSPNLTLSFFFLRELPRLRLAEHLRQNGVDAARTRATRRRLP